MIEALDLPLIPLRGMTVNPTRLMTFVGLFHQLDEPSRRSQTPGFRTRTLVEFISNLYPTRWRDEGPFAPRIPPTSE